ncbi:MAG TPA: hypothetical protein VK477_10265, partial [Acidobacteriota bacterium]|nr:hypothetical protein [Acidobacteriota bacterium]
MSALPYRHLLRAARTACALLALGTLTARAWIAPEEGQRLLRRVIGDPGRPGPVIALCALPNGEMLAAGEHLTIARPPFLGASQTVDSLTGLRAIAAGRGDRVWVGGYSDFGYLETVSSGERRFTSLRPALPAPYDSNRNLLGPMLAIAPLDDGAFFATENAL